MLSFIQNQKFKVKSSVIAKKEVKRNNEAISDCGTILFSNSQILAITKAQNSNSLTVQS